MTLVDHQIKQAIDDGAIVIHSPLGYPTRIGTNSIDVHLHGVFWRIAAHLRPHSDGTHRAHGAITLEAARLFEASPCEAIDGKIALGPYERILCVTEEFIGGTVSHDGSYAVLAHMHARSSWGRFGITTNLCAGFGDVGYINRWTMEVANLDGVTKLLPVGCRVGQIEFTRTSVPESLYGATLGQYQRGTQIEKLVAQWDPKDMLPKPIKADTI